MTALAFVGVSNGRTRRTIVAHPLDDIAVFDTEGETVRLGSLWADRPAVLVFVRHFGCLFCRQQVNDFLPYLAGFDAARAALVIVGNGTVAQARAFRDHQRLPVPLYTDPSGISYCAVGMRSGIGTVMRPAVIVRSLVAMARGFRQTRVAGNPLQQGGVVMVRPGGVEHYRYISRSAGDHPSPADVLRAAAGLHRT